MDRCKTRLARCKLTPDCLDSPVRRGRLIDTGDQICGTDAKTYANECELNHATCL